MLHEGSHAKPVTATSRPRNGIDAIKLLKGEALLWRRALRWESIWSQRYLVAACAVGYGLMHAVMGRAWPAFAMTMVLAVLGRMVLWILYLNPLQLRAAALQGPIWAVKVMDVKVAAISDAEHASLKLEVMLDASVHDQQAYNLLTTVACAIVRTGVAIPVVLFWAASALAFVAPGHAMDLRLAYGSATGPELQLVASWLLWGWMALVLLALLTSASRFGFVNCIDAEVGKRLLKRFSVVLEGPVTVVRQISKLSLPRS